jgi:hypothetical protein
MQKTSSAARSSPGRRHLGGAWPTPGVDTALLRQGNAGRLALPGVLQFDFGDAEQQAGNQMLDRVTQIDLLRDRDYAHPTLAPVHEHVDAFLETVGRAIKFSQHNGIKLAGKDSSRQLLKDLALHSRGALAVLEPLTALWRLRQASRRRAGCRSSVLWRRKRGYRRRWAWILGHTLILHVRFEAPKRPVLLG